MTTIDDRLRDAAHELPVAPGPRPEVGRGAARRRRRRRTGAASVAVIAAVLGVVALRPGTSPADRSPSVAAPTDVSARPSAPTTPATDISSGPAPETSVDAPANQRPIAVADLALTIAATPVAINVLANDVDPDGAHRQLVIAAVTAPARGTAVLTENIIVYRPADGFTGTDTFPYTVADANGATSTGVVTIEVISPNEP
ncbi:MAG: Ig-like domain-containing protein [Mycobacterium sp.]